MSTLSLEIPSVRRRQTKGERLLNPQNVTIGSTAVAFYAFSSTPMLFAATSSMGLSTERAVSWYVAVFLSAAVTSLVLSWKYRMPIPVGWSLPGLVFLTTVAAGHTHGELMSGVLITGVAMMLLGVLGVADKLVAWIPIPVVMGVFAGSVFAYCVAIFDHVQGQPWIVGAAVVAYFAAMAAKRTWMPPMAAAFIVGLATTAAMGKLAFSGSELAAPTLVPMRPEFTITGSLGIALPLILMAIAMGNVQGFGILKSAGFKPPVRAATVGMGLATIFNGFFGGHISTLQTNGTAIMASDEAGPPSRRYMATVLASIGCVALVVGAGSLGMLLGLFPAGLIPALAGLAVLTSLAESTRKSISNDFPLSGFVAMLIAASSVTAFGLGSVFWAFVGGILITIFLERQSLRRYLGSGPIQESPANA